ncbi:MAG: ABC transporter permease [Hungatella sp.]|jgi:peptide/nickel transport system permease protein|nr:ABC transporter permease [Hungatella sp.]
MEENRSFGRLREAAYQFARNRLAVVCLILLLVIVFAAVFADFVAPEGIDEQNIAQALQPPGLKHWFGTDNYGRDIFSRVIYGGRISLLVALLSTAVSTLAGVMLGAAAGYYGGLVDNVIMRIMDVFMAIPSLLMAIVLATSLGAGLRNTILAIAISSIPSFTRVVRAPVLSAKQNEYIEACRAIGARPLRLIVRHILPNVMAIIIVQSTLGVANAIISVASLSFLGLGVQPPTPEWGTMLSMGRSYITKCSWMVTYPGLAIVVSVICLNVLGDALRDVLDPRLKQ